MTPLDSIRNEYLHWPEVETVTVIHRRNAIDGGDAEDTVSHAVRMDLSIARRAFGIVSFRGDEIVWAIPVALLENVTEIVQGDQIKVSQDERYTVASARLVRTGTQWICPTHRER